MSELKRAPLPPRKTALKRSTKPLARSRIKRTRSPHEFPEAVKAAVRRRSGNRCEFRSAVCAGKAVVFHHRQRRAKGNSVEENCLHGCDACHKYAHDHPTMAKLMGWIVSFAHDPAKVPVRPGSGSP